MLLSSLKFATVSINYYFLFKKEFYLVRVIPLIFSTYIIIINGFIQDSECPIRRQMKDPNLDKLLTYYTFVHTINILICNYHHNQVITDCFCALKLYWRCFSTIKIRTNISPNPSHITFYHSCMSEGEREERKYLF